MLPDACQRRLLSAAVAVLAAAPAAAAGEWVAARSPHFFVASDAGERQARLVAHQFEQIRGLFQEVTHARVDSGQPIVILAVRDENGLRRLLPAYWERRGAAHPAGVFVGRYDKNYVALRLDAVGPARYSVIYHEYVHYLCSLSYSWLPVWLSEGLAEFYAATDIDDEQVVFGRIQPYAVRLLRETRMLPLAELLAADHSSPHYNEAERASIFYAEAAALTHYLLIDPQRRAALVEYLRLLGEGKDDAEAFRSALGPPETLEKELSLYVRRLLFKAHFAKVRLDAQRIETRALSAAFAEALQGDLLAHTGRSREARGRLEEALRLDPSLAPAHESMGVLELQEGRPHEAARWFARAVALSPDDALALYYGAAAADPSAEPEAEFLRRERDLSRAIELSPLFAPAFEELAEVYREAGKKPESARRLALRACSLEPARVGYRLELLRVLAAAGLREEADGVEKEMLRRAMSDPAALWQLVGFYEEQHRPQEAEALLVKAVAQRPTSPAAHSTLGRYLLEKERPDEAEAEFRKGLQIQPKDPGMLNELGYMNADRGVRVEEALALIDLALKATPREPNILDSRGWALYRLKRLDEAEKALRQAIALEPSPVCLDHLGDVLRDRGQLGEAIEVWQRARHDEQATEKLRVAIDAKLEVAASAAPAR